MRTPRGSNTGDGVNRGVTPRMRFLGRAGAAALGLAWTVGSVWSQVEDSADRGPLAQVTPITPQVQQAISKGLAYLASHQKPGGSWGEKHAVADTSLALMAFMLQGHVPGRGPYGQGMEKAIHFLLSVAEKNGQGFLGTPSNHAGMYEHGLAVLALSEAWGQSKNQRIRDVLRKAVDVTVRAQNPAGGWRYDPEPKDADLSMTVMHIVALNSAKEAGIAVPDLTMNKAMEFVLKAQHPPTGGFCYMPGLTEPGFARTAAGVVSLIMTGHRNHKAVRRGLEFMLHYPEMKFTLAFPRFFYAHYYAIQCVYQAGDALFQSWYPRISATILSAQKEDGSWSVENGVEYSTAMAILIVGVPYRYLPIYQR